jgi:hypothetical protein
MAHGNATGREACFCDRAADLTFLLEQTGKTFSRYARHLRREPGVAYYEGGGDE